MQADCEKGVEALAQDTSSSYRRLKSSDRVRLYDFHRPDKFSRENLGALRVLHDHMARLLATRLSAHVRTAVRVSLIALDQVVYEEFTEQMSEPVILGIGQFEPLEGKMAMEIEPPIAYPFIERLLGGVIHGIALDRPLTDMEAAVMTTVFEEIVEASEEAWQNVTDLTGQLESVETSQFFSQFAPPNEMMIRAGFLMEMADSQGRVNIAWPHMMLEPILPQLSVQHWMGLGSSHSEAQDDHGQSAAVRKHLHRVKLPVVAELGRTRVTVGDLLSLQPGDVLRLDTKADSSIQVRVDSKSLFGGYPGKVGSNLAVQITARQKGGTADV